MERQPLLGGRAGHRTLPRRPRPRPAWVPLGPGASGWKWPPLTQASGPLPSAWGRGAEENFDETGYPEPRSSRGPWWFAPWRGGIATRGTSGNLPQDQVPSWRLQLAYHLDATKAGRYMELADAALNLLSCALYVLLTEYTRGTRFQPTLPLGPPEWAIAVDAAVVGALLLLWATMLGLALSPLQAVALPISYLTLLATLPVLWNAGAEALAATPPPRTFLCAGDLIFLYPFRFWRLNFSVLRLLGTGRHALLPHLSLALRKGTKLCTRILVTLLTVSAWVHICLYIIQHFYDVTFQDVFYSISVSATSGLSTGEIVPDNPFSRAVILFVMICGALFIPTQLAELLSLIRNQPQFDAPYHPATNQEHILLVGTFEPNSLREVLAEFFSLDHGAATLTTQVVLLSPAEPSDDIRTILADPLYVNRVVCIHGTSMSWRDLRKAKASTAKACFVLGGIKGSTDAGAVAEEDAQTVMRTLSIKKFKPTMRIFAQVSLPSSKMHLDCLANLTICTEELKMGMLAQSVRCRGFSSFFHVLTTSPAALTERNLQRAPAWKREYFLGSVHEIYPFEVTTAFAGRTFAFMAEYVYLHHRCILFAIRLPVHGQEGRGDDGPRARGSRTLLYPAAHVLQCGDLVFFIGTQQSKVREFLRHAPPAGSPMLPELPGLERLEVERVELEESWAIWEAAREGRGRAPTSPAARSVEENFAYDAPWPGSRAASPSFQQLPMGREDARPLPSLRASAQSSYSSLLEPASSPPDGSPPRPLEHKDAHSLITLPLWIQGHVVVMSNADANFPSNLEYFLAPLRKRLACQVVVLCPACPSPGQWERLAPFHGQVYHVLGSPLVRGDLHRAKIRAAGFAIILAHTPSSGTDAEVVAYRGADAAALLSLLNVQHHIVGHAEHFGSLVEFVHPENMKFLGRGTRVYYDPVREKQKLVPAFVGGEVVYQAMFDSLLIQAYYNESLISVLKELIFMTNALALPHPDLPAAAHLAQFAVPPVFAHRPYQHFFSHCLRTFQCLPLGLYRRCLEEGGEGDAPAADVPEETEEAEERVIIRYVVVNPEPGLRLRADDHFFALRLEPRV